jgi:hypothetical protein
VEKRQRVPPGMGRSGWGRRPGGEGVWVRAVAIRVAERSSSSPPGPAECGVPTK